MKKKKTMTWKLWLLTITLALSLIAILGIPPLFLQQGVLVTGVEQNSTALAQGLRQGQTITAIDGKTVNDVTQYAEIVGAKYPSEDRVRLEITTDQGTFILFDDEAPQMSVANIPQTHIKTGLDLTGGSRALVQAKDVELTSGELNDLVDITNNRLNVYGLSDVQVLPITDLDGNHYMLVEVAGTTPQDLEELLSQQGKFEANIGNETVFIGGERDIESVCSSPTCSGIRICESVQGQGYYCNFDFTIYLSQEAAQRHADITGRLGFSNNATIGAAYLSEPLVLMVDGQEVDSLLISSDLKGRATTQISISGSGSGATQQEAFTNAQENMRNLQTILKTGSLPFELEIVKLDTVSPTLGHDFINAILIAGAAALLAVAIIVFIRYRNFKASIALVFTSFSEVIIILGIASLIQWNLDLPSIAGILATIGTGIDQQIILLDESRQTRNMSIAKRMRRAFAIILGAFFTSLFSLLPLWWAGAGLLKGFVFTTILGITAGVLITRPAFADMIKNIEEKEN